MSSLLQFNGRVDSRGIGLLCYLVKKGPEWEKYNGPEAYSPNPSSTTFTEFLEPIPSQPSQCYPDGLPQLYEFFRKPVGMFGPWVVFRYLGEEHVPDLSIPIALFRLPKGARKLSPEENVEAWK